MVAAFAVDGAARIVHHHLGAAAGQQQRMRATEPVAGAGDDGDAIVEADAHSPISPEVLSSSGLLLVPLMFVLDTLVSTLAHASLEGALGSSGRTFKSIGLHKD